MIYDWILNLWDYTTTSHCCHRRRRRCRHRHHHHHVYNSWEAKSCLANQLMSSLLRYPKFHTMPLRQTSFSGFEMQL